MPLTIYQGATFRISWTWKSGASAAAAVPVDLTGCTARAQIRATVESPNTLLELTTENGRIALGGAAGTVALYVSDEDTATLPAGKARWDLEIVWLDGDVTRLFGGPVVVSAEVTR
jgi:hypothetical protein